MSCPAANVSSILAWGHPADDGKLTVFSMEKLSQVLHQFHRCRIKFTLFKESVVKQGIEAPCICILCMSLVEVVELICKLLERHILQLLAGILCK